VTYVASSGIDWSPKLACLSISVEGDRRAGDREKRGREAGFQRWWNQDLKGYGKQEVKTPLCAPRPIRSASLT